MSEFAGGPRCGLGEVVLLTVPDLEGKVFEFAVWSQCGLLKEVDTLPSVGFAGGLQGPCSTAPDGLFCFDPAWFKSVRQALCRLLVGRAAPRRAHPAAPELHNLCVAVVRSQQLPKGVWPRTRIRACVMDDVRKEASSDAYHPQH